MKITSNTIMSMRGAASAVLVAGAITGASQGAEPSPVLTESRAIISPPQGGFFPSKGVEKAKDPENEEEKEKKQEPRKDPCPNCGLG